MIRVNMQQHTYLNTRKVLQNWGQNPNSAERLEMTWTGSGSSDRPYNSSHCIQAGELKTKKKRNGNVKMMDILLFLSSSVVIIDMTKILIFVISKCNILGVSY